MKSVSNHRPPGEESGLDAWQRFKDSQSPVWGTTTVETAPREPTAPPPATKTAGEPDTHKTADGTRKFVIAYHDIMEAIGDPLQCMTYFWLVKYANSEGYAWPSISTLCKKMGKTNKTVIKALDKLEERGYITSQRRWKNEAGEMSTAYSEEFNEYTSNLYKINDPFA